MCLARKFLLVVLMGIAALAACTNGESSEPADWPEAHTLINESAEQLQNASTFQYEIDVSGYPVEIPLRGLDLPDDYTPAFKYVSGAFQTPDRLIARIQFSVGDFSTTAELIALGTDQYFRGELLTANRWLEEQLISGFSPASLLAQPGGIPYALTTIENLELVGKTDRDGLDTYHLRGTINAADVYALTLGLIRTRQGQLDIEVFVHTGDHRLAQIKLIEPAPESVGSDDATIWLISILSYNDPLTITPPIGGATS